MTAERALADTSLFVALEQDRPLRQDLPSELYVSVITLAELRLGVLTADDPTTRAGRLETATQVAKLAPLPVDDAVARAWSELHAALRGTGKRLAANDSWIAATALAHELPVATQDGDYDGIPGLHVVKL